MNITAFNWIDYTALGLILFSVLISFARGFVREAISLAAWILAVWVAYKYGHDFGENFLTMIESNQLRPIVASAALFFAILILGSLISFFISKFLYLTGLSVIDRILGMAFGLTRGCLFVAVLILVGEITQYDKNPAWAASQIVPQFSGASEWLKSFVPEQFEKIKQQEGPEAPSTAPSTPPSAAQQPALESILPQAAVEAAKQAVTRAVTQPTPAPAEKPAASPAPVTQPAKLYP
jgi:membrane protein required for colicin V production